MKSCDSDAGEKIQAGQCNTVVEKLADYLRESGY